MTQKDKELLLKDICGRLPYGVKVQVYDNNRYAPVTLTKIDVKKQECVFNFNVPVENCLPYLRSMSSMTEEEKEEWHDTFDNVYDYVPEADDYDDNWHEQPGIESYDYLNAHHFDYRGLIPMGLALEALEGMYKN